MTARTAGGGAGEGAAATTDPDDPRVAAALAAFAPTMEGWTEESRRAMAAALDAADRAAWCRLGAAGAGAGAGVGGGLLLRAERTALGWAYRVVTGRDRDRADRASGAEGEVLVRALQPPPAPWDPASRDGAAAAGAVAPAGGPARAPR